MKLSSLYSNKRNFKRIDFNDGVNIIIGRINNPEIKNTYTHNLGKSLIVKLVDFLLLKENINKDFFLKKNSLFKDYVFFLELKLNNGQFVTIKRSVEKSTVVSIKIHSECRQNFTELIEWDYKDISVGETKNGPKAISIIQNLLEFDVLNNEQYRKYITYFMREQGDYNNPFLLGKYSKGRDSEWKPMLFELLGYDGELLREAFDITDSIEKLEKEIKEIEMFSHVKDGDIDTQQNIKKLCEDRVKELELNAKSFDFYLNDLNISKELIEDIEKKVSILNNKLYKVKSEIARISEELNVNVAYDYNAVFELYQEVQLIFPEKLKKNFEDLIEFNKKITTERYAKLNELQIKREEGAVALDSELRELNLQRVEALKKLQEVETFQKYNDAQSNINIWRKRVFEAEQKIEAIQDLREKEKTLAYEKIKYNTLRANIANLIEQTTEKATEIRNLFTKYVKRVINQDATLSLEMPQKKESCSIKFKITTLGIDGKETQAGDGYTYRKEICACMDLAILKSYCDRSFCRFVIHDGCVDSEDHRCAIGYLELIKELAENGLQCIVTMIDSVVPLKSDGSKYNLSDDEVILELNDNADGSGKLFGFNF